MPLRRGVDDLSGSTAGRAVVPPRFFLLFFLLFFLSLFLAALLSIFDTSLEVFMRVNPEYAQSVGMT